MKNFKVQRYKHENKAIWNTFISNAKNATFLFNRDFMDYHADRFEDYSLMVYDETEKLVALMPANKVENCIFSHQGLTYGGLVIDDKVRLSDNLIVFSKILLYLDENKIEKVKIKIVPSIYCNQFSDELDYCLFICKSVIYRKDSLSVIDLKSKYSISSNRYEGIKKGLKAQLTIKKDDASFEQFWNTILVPNLSNKHGATPVHSIEELKLLKLKFPNNIHFFTVHNSSTVMAGCVVFETQRVAHMQYISGDDLKSKTGSLDYLHYYLITDYYKDKNYFDFGTSTENDGLNINSGLLYWKETFGARTLVQDFHEVETKNYNLLTTVLL